MYAISNNCREVTHVMAEYPKWVEHDGKQVLIESDDDLIDLENDKEKKVMVKELREVYGKEIDLRKHKGSAGLGSLRAYYEGVKEREPIKEPAEEE